MCGISGYFNKNGANEIDLQRMNNAIYHRGPDEVGVFVRGNVALGQQRLSIIDLSNGQQPMSNEDGSIWITFNGEIYNFQEIKKTLVDKHSFKTNSDTEVIIHLYEEKGVKCLDDLRGHVFLCNL